MRAIQLSGEHRVDGHYILITSGMVDHLPENRYLVSEKQVKLLDEKKIPYTELSVDEFMIDWKNRHR